MRKTIQLFLTSLFLVALAAPAWAAWFLGDEGTWRFVVMGDHRSKTTLNGALDDYVEGGINTAAVQALAVAVRNEGVEFVLSVGDLVAKYDPKLVNVPGATTAEKAQNYIGAKLALWTELWNTYSGGLPVYPVRGNHETSASAATWINAVQAMPGIGTLAQYSPPGQEWLTYAFTHKNCLFIGMDVYPAGAAKLPTLTPDTLAWINEVFTGSDRPHVFAWAHVPAYEVWDTERIGFGRDGLGSPRPPTCVLDQEAVLNVRNPFWNLLGSEGARVYFCGHDHLYLRGVAAGIHQVIIGNGGAPAYPAYPPYCGLCDPTLPDPYVESSAGTVDNWGSPKITLEYVDQNGSIYRDDPTVLNWGYILVEIHGSYARATYKVKAQAEDAFEAQDSWTWKLAYED